MLFIILTLKLKIYDLRPERLRLFILLRSYGGGTLGEMGEFQPPYELLLY